MATNGNQGNELTSRQRRAIVALLSQPDIKTAAKVSHVGYRSILRWMEDSNFRAELIQAEGDAIDQATRQLVTLQEPAIKTIYHAMVDPGNATSLKLKAAQSVLDYLIKLRELRNVEQRLAALEAAVYDNNRKATRRT